MAFPNQKQPISAAEYLAIERKATGKSEFFAGEIFAMAGASVAHNRVVRNMIALLHGSLKGSGCEVFPSDLRVHIPLTESYVYPDVVIVCGQPEFLDDQADTLLNPSIIIEVLSGSTADFDRGGKFARYRSLPSLETYLLIDSESKKIERYTRENEGWWLEDLPAEGPFHLPPTAVSLTYAQVYEGV